MSKRTMIYLNRVVTGFPKLDKADQGIAMNRRKLLLMVLGLLSSGIASRARAENVLAIGTLNTTGSSNDLLPAFFPANKAVRKQFHCSAGHVWVGDDYGDCVISANGLPAITVNGYILSVGENRFCVNCLEMRLLEFGVGTVTSEPL